MTCDSTRGCEKHALPLWKCEDCMRDPINYHRAAQAMARAAGFDPTDEAFAKCVGAILQVTQRLKLAEEKLSANGIVWEEDRYVFVPDQC